MVNSTLASMSAVLVGVMTIAACGAGGSAGVMAADGVFEPVPGPRSRAPRAAPSRRTARAAAAMCRSRSRA